MSSDRERQVAELWHALFQEQHSSLMHVARMLLRDANGGEAVLERALVRLEGSTCGEACRPVLATRTVVKTAIAYNLESHNQTAVHHWVDPTVQEDIKKPDMESLPWLERAVYFLRNSLRYSRRDTALLLRIGDANVDQLFAFAERRIG